VQPDAVVLGQRAPVVGRPFALGADTRPALAPRAPGTANSGLLEDRKTGLIQAIPIKSFPVGRFRLRALRGGRAEEGVRSSNVFLNADALRGAIAEVISTGKESAVKKKESAVQKFVLHRIAIIVAAIAVGSAGLATDALARGGGGEGHSGGGMGGGHFGGMGEGHFGGKMSGGHFGGRAEHQPYGHYRGWGEPYGYYGDSGYYDPSTVAPDEQPPTTAYPYVKPPRSSCSTQTYKVPSEDGGEASVNVVRC
jgi:hypothetical protein